jgi:hypothetical protein
MGGGLKTTLAKSPFQSVGMRLMQGYKPAQAFKYAGGPLEQKLHRSIDKAIGGSKVKQKNGGNKGIDPSTGMMMQYMSQMQAQQAEQASAARQAQQAAFIESQKQAAASAAQQGELGSQQMLEQTGAMQQARDITAKEAQQRAYGAIGQSAVGEGFDINQAKQQQLSNIAGTGNIPYTSSAKLPFYGYNQNQDSGATGKYANIFSMPKTKGLTLGGI